MIHDEHGVCCTEEEKEVQDLGLCDSPTRRLQFERMPVPATGSCFYHALACTLMDMPDVIRVMGLSGCPAKDAQHLRVWVATSLFVWPHVVDWLRERLRLIRAVPDMLDEHDFIRLALKIGSGEGGMTQTLHKFARTILRPTTYVSEFEVTVMTDLLGDKVRWWLHHGLRSSRS